MTWCEPCHKVHDITEMPYVWRYIDTVRSDGVIVRTPVLTEESLEAARHWLNVSATQPSTEPRREAR